MTITPIQSTERAQVIAPAVATQATQSDTGPSPQEASASAYYFSPVLKIDPQTQSVVIQYRNSETGAVTNQYPSEKELKAYAAKQTFADLEVEPATGKATVFASASQPAPTATVDAAAVPPASTFNTATAAEQQALVNPATLPATAPEATSSSIVV